MRKSIFDIVAESIDMESETNRLVAMSSEEDVLVIQLLPLQNTFRFCR